MKEKTKWKKTHCARMDHGGCSLLVATSGNAIVKVKGDPDGFLNQGYICSKGLASPDRLTHPLRLKRPLKRKGKRGEGKWKTISWTEALTAVSENLNRIKQNYGAKAVAFCQGMPKGMEHFVLIRLANLFGSPNVVAVQDVCHAPREISGIQTCGFYPVVDFHHPSQLVVLWGSNPTSTNEEGSINRLLLSQFRQGTELIVVDPKKTKLAERAKFHLRLKPGTDCALALSYLSVIIQEKIYDKNFVEKWTHGFSALASHVTAYAPEKMAEVVGVSTEMIRKSARLYAVSHPAAIAWGNPIEQNIHAFDTARALVCLMAVCGNLDTPGGNIQAVEPNILGLGKFVRADRIPSKRTEMIHAHHHTIPGLMTVPSAFFRRAVLEEIPYPVKGAYMQCTNPLLGYADSRSTFNALMKLDFLAVSDIFMTPTACLADIVLPAATQFEFNDIGHYGLGHGYILARPKVVDPPKNCRPDIDILNELGKTITDPTDWFDDPQDLLDAVLKPCGLNFAEFAEKSYIKGPDQFHKYVSSGFKTPTGKVELSLSRAEKLSLPSLPQFEGPLESDDPSYPLIMTSSKSRYFLHSSYRWLEKLRKYCPKPLVEIHPDTARTYTIFEGDEVIIETRSGCITQFARVTDSVLPEVIHAAYGWWFPEGDPDTQFDWERSNVNMLTDSKKLGKAFGTPNLRGIPCRIRKKS